MVVGGEDGGLRAGVHADDVGSRRRRRLIGGAADGVEEGEAEEESEEGEERRSHESDSEGSEPSVPTANGVIDIVKNSCLFLSIFFFKIN